MPIDRRATLQLGLLLLAVPAQYFITKYMSADESQRHFALQRMANTAVSLKNKYMSWKYWQDFCLELMDQVHPYSDGQPTSPAAAAEEGEAGESPALEVLQYRDPKGHFATSAEPRSPRLAQIKYRVGQVVRHKRWGYRGVIVGWDPVARAPESWLEQMHPPDKRHWREQPNFAILVDIRDRSEPQTTYEPQENIEVVEGESHWRSKPNYSVLVDTRDRPQQQRTYVAEENIEVLTNVKVLHPEIEDHFEDFDGAQYLPRPWLKTIYPHD